MSSAIVGEHSAAFRFRADLGPDLDALGSVDDKPAFSPITRYLRAVGADVLKDAIRARSPSTQCLPVHVKQTSRLLMARDLIGVVSVDAGVKIVQGDGLEVDATVITSDRLPIARSVSTIAFVGFDQFRQQRTPTPNKQPTFTHIPLCVDADRVHRYCSVSGDDNPIHTDQSFAESLGLPGLTVPGALLLQLIEAHLHKARRCELTCQIESQFVDMVEIGETSWLSLRPSRSASGLPLRFVLSKPNGRIAVYGAVTA